MVRGRRTKILDHHHLLGMKPLPVSGRRPEMPSLAKFAALSLSTRGTTLLESASDEIRVLHSATVNILVANNRRVGLNKKFSALRRERPKLFAAAVEWLDNPDVQVELTTGGGGGGINLFETAKCLSRDPEGR